MTKRGLTPEEFNKFLNQKMPEDKIELFYRANFVNPLRVELFRDFIAKYNNHIDMQILVSVLNHDVLKDMK